MALFSTYTSLTCYEIIQEEPRIFSDKNIKPPITIEEIFRFSVPSEKCDVYDLLKYNKLVVTVDTIKKLEEVYA